MAAPSEDRPAPAEQAHRDRSHLRPRVGDSTSRTILEKTGVDADTRVGDLIEDEVIKLLRGCGIYLAVGALRLPATLIRFGPLRERARLMEIGSYRGLRHRRGLPVNGQPTKTSAARRRERLKSLCASWL